MGYGIDHVLFWQNDIDFSQINGKTFRKSMVMVMVMLVLFGKLTFNNSMGMVVLFGQRHGLLFSYFHKSMGMAMAMMVLLGKCIHFLQLNGHGHGHCGLVWQMY